MCLAIMNLNDTIPYQYLSNAWDNNSDGGGLLFITKGELQVFKSFDKKAFIKTYMDIRKRNKNPMLIHFRIATSGFKGKKNLHPFMVSRNLGFIHNGIISGLGDKDHSDTYEFCEILKKLPNFIYDKDFNKLIMTAIGSSKLAFLDNYGNYTIFNEKLGIWDGSNWYSNTTHKYVYTAWKAYDKEAFYDDYKKTYPRAWDDDDYNYPYTNTKALELPSCEKPVKKVDDFEWNDFPEESEADYLKYLEEIFEDNIKESGVSAESYLQDVISFSGVGSAKEYFEQFV